MPSKRVHRSTPSRKKSCLTCAKAKIRCHLERPQCSTCVASGRTCIYAAPPIPRSLLSPSSPSSSSSSVSAPVASVVPPELSDPRAPLPPPARITAQPRPQFRPPLLPQPQQQPLPQHEQQSNQIRASLNFASLDLVPLSSAESIRDRWLRPFLATINDQQQQQQQLDVPKAFHPYTLQYITCALRTYPKLMADDDDYANRLPSFIHPMQTHGQLANCRSLARLWQHRAAGSEAIVADTVRREMDRLAQVRVSLPYSAEGI